MTAAACSGRRLQVFDIGFAVLAGAAMLLRPVQFDEGWQILTIENWLRTGRFSFVIGMGDQPYTFMKPMFWLYGQLYDPGDVVASFFLLRIPALLANLAAWLLISRGLRSLGLLTPGIVMLVLFVLGEITVLFLAPGRAEAFSFLAVAAVFHGWARFVGEGAWRPFVAALPVVAIATAVHHVAVVAVLLWLAAFAIDIFPRLDVHRLLATVATGAMSGVLGIGLLLWDLSPAEFATALSVQAKDPMHSLPMRDEVARYGAFLVHRPVMFCYLFLPLLALILTEVREQLPLVARRFIPVYAVICFAFLLLHPAKWPYYVVVYVPVSLAVLAALARPLDAILRQRCSGGAMALALVALLAWRQVDHFTVTVTQPSVFGALTGLKGHDEVAQARTLLAGRLTAMPMNLYPILRPAVPAPLDRCTPVPELVVAEAGIVTAAAEACPTAPPRTCPAAVSSFSFEGRRFAVFAVAGADGCPAG